jgi:signal transduction histidine kinase
MAASAAFAAPPDPKARLVSIFVGAVLLPSIALSVVSFNSIPKLAEATQITLRKRAERVLFYIEEDLERAARAQALEAAKIVGPERLLEGRVDVIRAALAPTGMAAAFEMLRLEASSPIGNVARVLDDRKDVESLREALGTVSEATGDVGDDALPVSGTDAQVSGVLRFRYACSYAHGTLIREYFMKASTNPDQAMVVRVTEPNGDLVYESAPTPGGDFEVQRTMVSASFRGLKLFLRYRDRSIRQDVHRWALAKTGLIAFIDLMLGAGLFLVYRNVQREVRLSRLKSDFVANVSHELKTPLALIRLFSETLELGRVPSPEKARQYYSVINKESQRLTQLINNILDFSRIEAGKREYRFAPTDLRKVVREMIEAYRFQAEQHGFILELLISEETPEVEVDKEAVSQALINLLNNAFKYSPKEKFIRVELRPEGDEILLSVLDRGIGIAKAEQKKIFEKFYRAEDSLVHETKGSGLGLSLVRHIMEAHGGEVRVESALGKGSTFVLVLPQDGARARQEREPRA